MTRFIALASISAAILAYQVLLTRLFAIVQWHHFAFIAISVALLGFGISAAALAIAQRTVERRLDAIFVAGAFGFAIASPVAFLIAQHIPFNALELVWRPSEILGLGAIYLVLAVPFTAGAACICLAFLRIDDAVGRVYFWNLLGSAAGALAIVPALTLLSPVGNLAAVAVLGMVAGLLAAMASGGRRTVVVAATLSLLLVAGWSLMPDEWRRLNVDEQKGLAVALNIVDARLVEERFGPLGLVSVVESPAVPFRSAPGLSLSSPAMPRDQIGLFLDGETAAMIDADAGRTPPDYLRYMTDAAVYTLIGEADVLIVGAAGGRDIAQALAMGARHVDAIEANAHFAELMRDTFAGHTGNLYGRDDVDVLVAEPRSFLASTVDDWDVIVVAGASAGSSGASTHGLNETYLLTVEAMERLLERLRPGGWLSITQPLDLPPRGSLKLVLTALDALERLGAPDPAEHLIVVRGMATVTLMIGKEPASAGAIDDLVAFAESRAFDLVYLPGMTPETANRFNVLAEPVFHDAMQALAGDDRDDYMSRYKFDIRPATDDRPYFHDFFRWRSLSELLDLRSSGGAGLIELGKPILVGTLAQAALLGLVLILLPIVLSGLARGRGRLVMVSGVYFTAVGMAFFLVEIAFIHKFVQFLGHPTYAIAVVLAGFLIFAGLGARTAERFTCAVTGRLGFQGPTAGIDLAVAGLLLVAVVYLLAVPVVFAALAGLPTVVRAVVSLALIAPLAFFMGMPFPLALAIVRRQAPALTAWAWGVNGCASVVSIVLAVLLAMHVGYAAVVVIALVLYAVAASSLRAMPGESA